MEHLIPAIILKSILNRFNFGEYIYEGFFRE